VGDNDAFPTLNLSNRMHPNFLHSSPLHCQRPTVKLDFLTSPPEYKASQGDARRLALIPRTAPNKRQACGNLIQSAGVMRHVFPDVSSGAPSPLFARKLGFVLRSV